ncbi:LSR2-like protein [Gordonia hirsuta DSM 44140 = NBRC 16056]|uniref:LSR2-like protein n=1 Tax=Gordonia hirsuta DSM 44140 = NBRC 16056 TaxID=1121927 RepID=L7L571_9ACTN|nr:Lsr2 family protein [Gordonia hirsuta]GAC56290.1 LSR2-like protein [Gordonia hirsuta DSM 44140 = NBRC 16056]
MAKVTKIQIVDDIDGAELDDYETVRWSLDGKNYEFDTSPAHAAEFRELLDRYQKVSRTISSRPVRRAAAKAGDTRAIRAWATENGFAVSDRGRIPADVVAAYEAAH